MKTHETAKALAALSRALRGLPDMEIDALKELTQAPSSQLSNDSIAWGLTTLVSLAAVDKSQWTNFILENNFPIQVRAKDSSRDILGRLFTYLQNNKEARNSLAHSSRSEKTTTSPELQRALQILLRP